MRGQAAEVGGVIGALAASAVLFTVIVAVMMALTGGSAWMLASVPLVMAACGWVSYLILAPVFRDGED